jgi:hypothetical protein|tara:strand:- start:23535 stop:23969 length:435 start_codon:yes stop_codon:yes gene_type:complete
MAKKRTEKSKYPSRYSPNGWVHAAQYITELICEKKAQIDKKELPLKFWELKEWLKFYRYQITLANKLIKEYGEHVIISALRDKRMWKTYSLRSPFLKNVIEEYKNKQELAMKIAKEVEYDFSEKKTFESSNKKKSIISKLRDLE